MVKTGSVETGIREKRGVRGRCAAHRGTGISRRARPFSVLSRFWFRGEGAVLRCRLIGRAETSGLAVAWQASFEAELRRHLAQLLPEVVLVQLRARSRQNKVSVHVSFQGAHQSDAIALEQGFADGSLRRLALRNCSGLNPWPTSQALRQFLLRDVSLDTFWVVERHEWHIPSFLQVRTEPEVRCLAQGDGVCRDQVQSRPVLASQPFDLGGGRNLTLHLHPAGVCHPGQPGACLTLSAAGHGLPSFPFLLSAGPNSEIWAGPYGRDSGNRFLSGGALCGTEELQQLAAVDAGKTLVLAVEAVQLEPPDGAMDEVPVLPEPQVAPAEVVPAEPQATWRELQNLEASLRRLAASPRSEPEPLALEGAQLLAAVAQAAKGVEAAAAALADQPWRHLAEAMSATHQRVEDLAQQLAELQAKTAGSPEASSVRQRLNTALELAGSRLMWQVSLWDSQDPESPRLLLQQPLNDSASTVDFQD
ncbi:unnamed protein product [Effrenium voratum]|uniref:Uncharacterized protein n=1 Tax=Effrenium voratum TaxID=2562239 RepID=A0AA36MJF3_9DINO|nr:unnamed protein product [Effrenium voratum]